MSHTHEQQGKGTRPNDKGAGREHVVLVQAGTLTPDGTFAVKSTGTGFVVRPGRLATALHVLLEDHSVPASRYDGIRLSFARPRDAAHYEIGVAQSWGQAGGAPARDLIKLAKMDAKLDWALLDFSACLPIDGQPAQAHEDALAWDPKPLDCGGDWAPQEACQLGGFAGDDSRLLGGTVGTYIQEGGHRRVLQVQLTPLEGETGYDPGGFSGGPVIVREHVVGMACRIDPIKLKKPSQANHHPEPQQPDALAEPTQAEDTTSRRARGGVVFAIPIEALPLSEGLAVVPPKRSNEQARQELEALLDRNSCGAVAAEPAEFAAEVGGALGEAPLSRGREIAELAERLLAQRCPLVLGETLKELADSRSAYREALRALYLLAGPWCSSYARLVQQIEVQSQHGQQAVMVRMPVFSERQVEMTRACAESRPASYSDDLVATSRVSYETKLIDTQLDPAKALLEAVVEILKHPAGVPARRGWSSNLSAVKRVKRLVNQMLDARRDRTRKKRDMAPFYLVVPYDEELDLSLVKEHLRLDIIERTGSPEDFPEGAINDILGSFWPASS